jgi:glycosyltransferase involved in cell wall biosynthesis
MRVIVLNNYFYLRGGSERVFHDEMAILEKKGHKVAAFCRAHPSDPEYPLSKFFPNDIQTQKLSNSLKGLKTVFNLFYSNEAKGGLSRLLDTWPADLAHAHNIYGRLTTSILDELARRNIPAVLTLHDYKLICPSYKLEYRGAICEECRGVKFHNAIKNRCHKGSLLASGIYSAESYFNHFRKSYTSKLTKLISPSKFLRNKFIEFGWEPSHIEVVPNFLDAKLCHPRFTKGDYFLYLGRLSAEKGIPTLLKAFSGLPEGARLVVAGTGPLEGELRSRYQNSRAITFIGYISGEKLKLTIQDALAVVIPSEWYENAPMSVLEAMAYGKPVIGADIGGIPEMVKEEETGFLFDPGNVQELQKKLARVAALSEREIRDIGHAARAFVEKNHSAELHYERLMAVYKMALTSRSN